MNKKWCPDFQEDIDQHIEKISRVKPQHILEEILYNFNNKEVQKLDKFFSSHQIIKESSKIINKKILLVSNNTYEPVIPHIKLAFMQKNIFLEVEDIGYGDPIPTLLKMCKSTQINKFDYILVSLDEDYFFKSEGRSMDFKAQLEEGIAKLNQIKSVIENSDAQVTLIFQSLISKTPPISLHYEDMSKESKFEIGKLLNKEMLLFRSENCLFLDLKYSNIKIDHKYHYFGKLPFSINNFSSYADFLASLIFAHLGLTKKVLVLDLDNTLWGGVIGDAGIDGIRIKIGDPLGEAFLDFQKYCKMLSNRGIVLCVCSKNNIKLAKEPFEKLLHLPLSIDDFIVFKANWSNKADNLKEIALTLNLGLESIVFVDDNPAEREIIRQSLPMVSVPEIGSDPSLYPLIISEAGYFSSIRFSDSDKNRIKDYKANIDRENLKKQSININKYLSSLKMTASEIKVNKDNLQRASQMTLKTNQFNTNSLRLNEGGIKELLSKKNYILLQYQLRDKFADNGIVSLVILKQKDKDIEIVNWVMSCRVFERGFENYIFNKILDLMATKGIKNISASVVKNDKNIYIHDLYEKLGFKLNLEQEDTNIYKNSYGNLEKLKTFINDEAI